MPLPTTKPPRSPNYDFPRMNRALDPQQPGPQQLSQRAFGLPRSEVAAESHGPGPQSRPSPAQLTTREGAPGGAQPARQARMRHAATGAWGVGRVSRAGISAWRPEGFSLLSAYRPLPLSPSPPPRSLLWLLPRRVQFAQLALGPVVGLGPPSSSHGVAATVLTRHVHRKDRGNSPFATAPYLTCSSVSRRR